MSFFIRNVLKAYFVWSLCWYFTRQRWLKRHKFASGAGSAMCALDLVAQSRPTLCNPMDCSSPGTSVHGDFPCPPPGDLPNLEIESRSPTLQADSLSSEPAGNPNSAMRETKVIKVTLRWVHLGFVLRAVRENILLCQTNWLKDRP